MKKFMITLSLSLLLVACSDDQKEAEVSTTAVPAVASKPEIMSFIPANSPVLLTSGMYPEQYPARYNEVMQQNLSGVIKYLQVMLKNELSKESTHFVTTLNEAGEEELVEEVDTEAQAMKDKVKAFADKWLTDNALEQLGLKMGETQMAVYLVDLFPVLRIKLSEGHQIDAFLSDLEAEFGVSFVTTDVNGLAVKEMPSDKVTLMMSTDNDYLVITGAPTVIKDQMVNALMGVEKPATSLMDDYSLVNEVKAAHGYVNDDVFVLDVQKLADYFIYPAKHNSAMVNFMQIDDNMLSATCKTEITGMIGKAPRMVAGVKTMTDDTIQSSFVWEMDPVIAADMATLAGRVPKGNPDAAMNFGMSFDLLAAKNLASKYVDSALADPYQCELMASFNQQLSDMQAKLSQPLPPFVGNFKGFSFSLDELKLNMDAANAENPNPKDMVESLKTQVYLAVDETQALLGMAQMMVPQLQGMEIKTDGSLITLADQVPMISGKDIPIDIANLYAAVSADTIGISLGHEGGGSLSEKVQEAGDRVLMTASMNVDGYKQLMEQIFAVAEMPNMPADIKEELMLQKELTMSMLYWKTQDMSLSFTDQGFTTDVSYTY